MDCLANIKFLNALGQPMKGLAHQLWEGSKLISEYVTTASGESVWIRHPEGTMIDVRVRNEATAEYNLKVTIKLYGLRTVFIIYYPDFIFQELSYLTTHQTKACSLIAKFKANMINGNKKITAFNHKNLSQNFKLHQSNGIGVN